MGICNRIGIGKVRHLAVSQLWVQERLRDRTFALFKVRGDANPANLDPLPPEGTAKKFVDYMGGPEAVLKRARADFEAGEYRWVAQVMKEVVFADPDNGAARELAAAAFEQLAPRGPAQQAVGRQGEPVAQAAQGGDGVTLAERARSSSLGRWGRPGRTRRGRAGRPGARRGRRRRR